ENAEFEIDAPLGRPAREPLEADDEGVGGPGRLVHGSMLLRGPRRLFSIMNAYGHAAAVGIRGRRRQEELLAGGRAPWRHAAGGQPPDRRAREAARRSPARPLGTPC